MRKNSTRFVVYGGLIAALYVVLTLVSQLFGLANGVIQVRLSESLCMLPCLTSAAIPGLSIGCLIANFIMGNPWQDVVFGTLATVIGAFGTLMMRKKAPQWSWIPPVLSNAIIVPIVLIYAYHVPDAWWFLVLTVGAGELIACGLIGLYVYPIAQKALGIQKSQL